MGQKDLLFLILHTETRTRPISLASRENCAIGEGPNWFQFQVWFCGRTHQRILPCSDIGEKDTAIDLLSFQAKAHCTK